MFFYVYLIKTIKGFKNKSYVGYTNNINNRIAKHNSNKGAKATKGYKWELVFKKKFKDSNYSLDYVLRYYYATAINLGCDKNELISMSGLVFPIESAKPDEIVEEVMSLIGNMYYGRKEDKDFKRKIEKN